MRCARISQLSRASQMLHRTNVLDRFSERVGDFYERCSVGVIPGVLGFLFGLLGMYSAFGMMFVPLAAVFSVIGLVSGLLHLSGKGIFVSLIGAVLTLIGFADTPGLWLQ